MCFSAKASLGAFLIGLVGSLLLVSLGGRTNISFGVFFIFISLIQLMDFAIWSDLGNKIGLNKAATMIGPILNVGQPLIMFIIKIVVFQHFQLDFIALLIPLLNAVYAGYLARIYYLFIKSGDLTTKVEQGHLKWPWLKYANPIAYLIMFVINALYLTEFRFSLFVTIITLFFLFLSKSYFAYHVGEMWCYFGAFIPMLAYFLGRK
jgi:hypothetical protein